MKYVIYVGSDLSPTERAKFLAEREKEVLIARAWRSKALRTWFFEGIQLIERGLPLDVFLLISSHVLGFTDSHKETKEFFERYMRIKSRDIHTLTSYAAKKNLDQTRQEASKFMNRLFCRVNLQAAEDEYARTLSEITDKYHQRNAMVPK